MDLNRLDRLNKFASTIKFKAFSGDVVTIISVIDRTKSKVEKYGEDNKSNEYITGFILVKGTVSSIEDTELFKIVNENKLEWKANKDFCEILFNGHTLDVESMRLFTDNGICCITPSSKPATWNMIGAACIMHGIDITNKEDSKNCLVNFLIVN